MSKNIYYTYAWLREDRTPYYIGKGCGKRAFDRRRKFCPSNDRILILKKDLSEHEAFKHEIYMIAMFGRKDLGTGILRNKTNGGDGISMISDETRRKMSKAKSGKNHPNHGKKLSIETRQKISKSEKGKIVSKESRDKMSRAFTGRTHTEETKRLMSEARSGENHPMYGRVGEDNPNYGRKHTKETRRKMSETAKLREQKKREAKRNAADH